MGVEPHIDIESGYGGSDSRNVDDNNGYATSGTYSSSANAASNDEENQHGFVRVDGRHAWLIPFFINIFLSCASFSIVVPSLAPYLLNIGAPLAFLPWVLSSYSIGEMFGSVTIGRFYEHTTKYYETKGRGPKLSMLLCTTLGVIGSAMYSAAGWIENEAVAKYCLLTARLIQGVWTGGQQAVEQAYLSAAVQPSKRTEYTAILSTCALLAFVMGPTIGAFISQIDTTIFGLPVDANNSAGIFMLIAASVMSLQTAFFFDGTDDTTGSSTEDDKKRNDEKNTADEKKMSSDDMPFNFMGVTVCMVIFYVHYYSFSVKETITAPMVMVMYRWDAPQVNLLFTGAGIVSLITSFTVRYLARYVDDRTLLMTSILIGFLGSTLLVDIPLNQKLPVWRFLLGFSLITVAFPVGKNVVLGIFGNILGEVNQGRWMGTIFAVSAFPRVVGPFVSLELLIAVDWKTWLEFGICASLFGVTLLVTCRRSGELIPYADFVNGQGE